MASLPTYCVASDGGKATPSGVTGIVSLSPGCPGPQSKDQACVKPLVGKEVQLIDNAGKVVGQATTADDGKFSIDAKHGKFKLKVVIDGMYPRCQMADVVIKKNSTATANISCDSGMR